MTPEATEAIATVMGGLAWGYGAGLAFVVLVLLSRKGRG